MNNQDSIAKTLDRAQGLLSYLVEHREDCAPTGPGAKQLQNMVVHVTNINEWIATAPVDPSNAIKRLRDFSNTIERLKVPCDSTPATREACSELVECFRLAAGELETPGDGKSPVETDREHGDYATA